MPSSSDQRSSSISFSNAAGEKLVGTLVLAEQPTDAIVLLCHGYASRRNGFQLPRLAESLAAAGFNSFRWDFSGSGDSQGVFRFANYDGEVQEIRAAMQLMEQQHGQQVVALLGHSKGGCDVILYAAEYDDIPLVLNVAGRFHMREGITMRFGADIFERLEAGPVAAVAQRDDGLALTYQLTKQDMHERLNTDMAAAAAAIRCSKVLTIHGTADTVIPVEDGRQFSRCIANSSLVEVDGADHNFRGERFVKLLVDAVVNFIRQNTQQTAGQQ